MLCIYKWLVLLLEPISVSLLLGPLIRGLEMERMLSSGEHQREVLMPGGVGYEEVLMPSGLMGVGYE